jgi:hypothetical protein
LSTGLVWHGPMGLARMNPGLLSTVRISRALASGHLRARAPGFSVLNRNSFARARASANGARSWLAGTPRAHPSSRRAKPAPRLAPKLTRLVPKIQDARRRTQRKAISQFAHRRSTMTDGRGRRRHRPHAETTRELGGRRSTVAGRRLATGWNANCFSPHATPPAVAILRENDEAATRPCREAMTR